MRLTHFTSLAYFLLILVLTIDTVFAAKIVGKDSKNNVVTLDEQFKKGTRLEVFVGEIKIGLIQSLGGYKAEIIYGKDAVDVGAFAWIKVPYLGSWRISYSRFPFLNVRQNPNYVALTSEEVNTANSSGYRLRLRTDGQLYESTSFGGAGLYLDYSVFGSYFTAIELGLVVFIGWEIIQDIVELQFQSTGGFLINLSERKWARPVASYDDDINRNEGKATIASYVLPISVELGGGLDFRITEVLTFFVYSNYKKLIWVEWEDTERPRNEDVDYEVRKEWLEYSVDNLGGIYFELGFRFRTRFDIF